MLRLVSQIVQRPVTDVLRRTLRADSEAKYAVCAGKYTDEDLDVIHVQQRVQASISAGSIVQYILRMSHLW